MPNCRLLAGAMNATYLHHFELEVRSSNMERALSILERVRGRTAAAVLENKVSFGKNESDEVRALEEAVSDLQLRLMRSESPEERARLLDQLVEYERRLEWTRTERRDSKPEWFEKPSSLKEIQGSLRSDEVVLEYVLTEPKSYCVWISKTKAGLEVLPAGRKRIEELTQQYLAEVRAKRDNNVLSKQLHDILLGALPTETNRERLIVVPDGMLNQLPFDTLRDPTGAFLLESRTLSYAPASTVLTVLRTAKVAQVPRRTFLGVGDIPYQNQGHVSSRLEQPSAVRQRIERGFSDTFGTTLFDLPQTREEVLSVSRIVGNDGVLLLGATATETAFKSEPLSDFKIVHIAAHGFSNTQFPARSCLFLSIVLNSPYNVLFLFP